MVTERERTDCGESGRLRKKMKYGEKRKGEKLKKTERMGVEKQVIRGRHRDGEV